ncbi:MAG TPA: hypothetical protein ENI27_05260 [bacterium]|nr:hypothetical protein [bacterium]
MKKATLSKYSPLGRRDFMKKFALGTAALSMPGFHFHGFSPSRPSSQGPPNFVLVLMDGRG